jgi:subtilase family serine protease
VLTSSQYRQIVPKGIFKVPSTRPCDPQRWYLEETIDVEAVHAMAPGADIVYSGAQTCNNPDMDASLNTLVDEHLVDMVSNSYVNDGEGESTASSMHAYDQIFTQAAAEGIGIYFASGDAGDNSTPVSNFGLGHPAADWPASDPLVTAVGGTSTGIAADGSIAVEQAWESTGSEIDPKTHTWYNPSPGPFFYGSGGGTSRKYSEPAYQKGVVPGSLARRYGGQNRVEPDVAMDADPVTGITIGETQTFPSGVKYGEYMVGGTSLACPLFVGVMALADQEAGFHHGFANPALYHVNASAFRDVKPGAPTAYLFRLYNNNVNANQGYSPVLLNTFDRGGNTIHSAVGYDDETGRGVPRGMHFLALMR